MSGILHWISTNLTVLTALGGVVAFLVSIFQFLSVRKRESQEREFQHYHQLIEWLVAPGPSGSTHVDRQVAVVFELRHFPRYFECTQRILAGLQVALFCGETKPEWLRLQDEINRTMFYIKNRGQRRFWL